MPGQSVAHSGQDFPVISWPELFFSPSGKEKPAFPLPPVEGYEKYVSLWHKNKIYMNQYNDSSEVEHIIDNTIESHIEDIAIRFAEYLNWKPSNEDNSQTQASENTDNRQQ